MDHDREISNTTNSPEKKVDRIDGMDISNSADIFVGCLSILCVIAVLNLIIWLVFRFRG
jgi:hypothetical protein